MRFLSWLSGMGELPHYILSRGLLLTCALLGSCLTLLLCARVPGADPLLLGYAEHVQTMALIVLGAGLIGSALMEDVLEYTGGV